MDVTNDNAGDVLPHIRTLLSNCTFFAVDLEFSGIDFDGPEVGADTPDAVIGSLLRKPADMYAAKLEALKTYSMMQIGISIFTESTASREQALRATGAPDVTRLAGELVNGLADDVQASVPSSDDQYCRETIGQIRREYTAVVGQQQDLAAHVRGWDAMHNCTVKEMASVGDRLRVLGAAETQPGDLHAENSLSMQLRRYRFLEALSQTITRRKRLLESGSSSSDGSRAEAGKVPATPKEYQVQTFTAYTLPAACGDVQDVCLNISTVEFLVKNNLDLMSWVKHGLRFAPLKSLAASLAQESQARMAIMEQLSQPHQALSGYTARFGNRLDDLLPFSTGELQLVKFVLDLPSPNTAPGSRNVLLHYIGVLHHLIQLSRGQLPDTALPESVFTKDAMYRNEMEALTAAGLTKGSNHKYARSSASGRFVRGSGGASGAGSSMTSHMYGADLLAAVLDATEVGRKPIVFYNGYTDLFFLLLSLYGANDMPRDLDTFKSVVHRHFPVVYDTRVLSCGGSLQSLGNFTGKLSSVVDEMAKVDAIASRVSFRFDCLLPGGSDPAKSSAAHNAGFDAMLTGKLYAYATFGIQQAGVDFEVYENFLATYNTLLSINLLDSADGVLQEEETAVYFIADSCGLRVDAIRDALAAGGLTALVMYRGSGYTVQPVGQSCQKPNFMETAQHELTRRARSPVTLLKIDI